jgi:hypothetical protein
MKVAGKTPTTSNGTPSNVTLSPRTPLLAAKRFCHVS